MGDPKKTKKHFERPRKLWDSENLEAERALKNTYALKNKREIWRTKSMLSRKRATARKVLAMPLEEKEKRETALLQSLARLGLLGEEAGIDAVLTLSTEAVLERRLQTMVWRKGLANTPRQARQFVTHGHIAVNGRKITAPGHLVSRKEEEKIGYFGKKMELKPKEKKPAAKQGTRGKEETESAAGGEKATEKEPEKEEKQGKEAAGKKEGEGKGTGEGKKGEEGKGKALEKEDKETRSGKEEKGKGKAKEKKEGEKQ